MKVRLDKWLQVARIFKTRSQAGRACRLGRIRVNGAVAKPHHLLAVGDLVELERAGWPRAFEVRELRDKPLPKADASRVYEDRSPPRPEVDPMERQLRRPPAQRDRGTGRPTKRQRRVLARWIGKP